MPELPEVETICRGIGPHLIGRAVQSITTSGKQLRSPIPVEKMRKHLLGNTISSVSRRAKYLLLTLDDGSLFIIHLGMTGNLGLFAPSRPPARHCHVRLLLSDGMELRYTDIRRFGSMYILSEDAARSIESTFFQTTGPEPFAEDFNEDYLYTLARSRSIAIKTFIMTNQVVAGVGNIYANESLFEAGIHPGCKANRISRKRLQRLIHAIRRVLLHAIECGGSTISDYVNASQENGYFQMHFQVYGHAGKPCRKCDGIIHKQRIGGRASYYCPRCQK